MNLVLVFQVCDSTLQILNVNAQFPGSAGDPWIYRRSGVRTVMQNAFQENPCWLLGKVVCASVRLMFN